MGYSLFKSSAGSISGIWARNSNTIADGQFAQLGSKITDQGSNGKKNSRLRYLKAATQGHRRTLISSFHHQTFFKRHFGNWLGRKQPGGETTGRGSTLAPR